MEEKTEEKKTAYKIIKRDLTDKEKENKMPAPDVSDYDKEFIIKQAFVQEVWNALSDIAYVDSSPMLFFLENVMKKQNGHIKNALLTEYIRRLYNFPFKNVQKIIYLISNPQTVSSMFVPLEPEPDKNDTSEENKENLSMGPQTDSAAGTKATSSNEEEKVDKQPKSGSKKNKGAKSKETVSETSEAKTSEK